MCHRMIWHCAVCSAASSSVRSECCVWCLLHCDVPMCWGEYISNFCICGESPIVKRYMVMSTNDCQCRAHVSPMCSKHSTPITSRVDMLQNHLEERLLDQAQARASYTPLFWGHSRSIPQGMILDVQPLVKSLFCPIRASPNGFFDFEASTP